MRNTSHDEMTDRQPVQPMMETYEGDNNPYRGIETHGVAPNARPMSVPGFAGEVEVDYEDVAAEQEAVPVRIVNTSSKQIRGLRAFREYADPTRPPRMVLGYDPQRTKAKIKNITADNVLIGGSEQEAHLIGGYVVAQNEVFETTCDQPVYVQTTHAANVATLCVMVEYTTDVE
jgi:hypothetical protein